MVNYNGPKIKNCLKVPLHLGDPLRRRALGNGAEHVVHRRFLGECSEEGARGSHFSQAILPNLGCVTGPCPLPRRSCAGHRPLPDTSRRIKGTARRAASASILTSSTTALCKCTLSFPTVRCRGARDRAHAVGAEGRKQGENRSCQALATSPPHQPHPRVAAQVLQREQGPFSQETSSWLSTVWDR